VIGQKGVEPPAAAALHELAGLGLRLLLASNVTAAETHWPAWRAAGVHELFAGGSCLVFAEHQEDDPLFTTWSSLPRSARLTRCCSSGMGS
jgi:hypothetical protein